MREVDPKCTRSPRRAVYASLLLTSASMLAIVAPCGANAAESEASAAADASVAPAATTIEEIIVTAQKREESLQSVPIAVSALSGSQLEAARIQTGAELQLSVPNLVYARGFVGSDNYTIRGIGKQLQGATSDAGVGTAVNGAPLTVSRMSNADFYDVQRVEVLRGPQGTQFGRNTTGGVVNVITNKPTHTFGAELTAEVGNYGQAKAVGYINLPLGDMLAVRFAGVHIARNGIQDNVFDGSKIDSRKINAFRATVDFKPAETFDASLMWEHLREADSRTNGMKMLCVPDNGPSSVGGVPVNAVERNYLSLGCLPTSIYASNANGVPNAVASVFSSQAAQDGVFAGNPFAGATTPIDRRSVFSSITPEYRNTNDNVQLNLQWQIQPWLRVISLTGYSNDKLTNRFDLQAADPVGVFNITRVTPNGVFNDPQIGPSNKLRQIQYWHYEAEQWTQEVRFQSSFDGPVNFNLGGIYAHLDQANNYATYANAFEASLQLPGVGIPTGIPIDTTVSPDPQDPQSLGHNYFPIIQPFKLESKALFGEVYWNVLPDVKVTSGLRYTDDQKKVLVYPSTYFRATPVAFGQPGYQSYPCPGVICPFVNENRRKTTTGRLNVSWTPELSFTDQSLFYASYARGYKGGGLNPAAIGTASAIPFAPEFVDAYEIGTKNTALGRRLVVNVTGFFYDYTGYQIAIQASGNTITSNLDAHIYGIEAETTWQATDRLRLNANVGLLRTSVQDGPNSSLINLGNPTNGRTDYTAVRSYFGQCVVPTALLANVIAKQNAGTPGYTPVDIRGYPYVGKAGVCGGAFAADGLTTTGASPTVIASGFASNIVGNKLPNAPTYSVSVGAQYTVGLPSNWQAVVRGDFFIQGGSFSTVFNQPENRIHRLTNVNMTVTLTNPESDWQMQAFAKNIFNKDYYNSGFTASTTTGYFTYTYVRDPALYGFSVTKTF